MQCQRVQCNKNSTEERQGQLSFYTNNACTQGLEEKRLAATGKQKINAHNECAQGQTGDGQAA